MNEKAKVAVVTGASKGIGKAISIGLGQMGYQTILIARDKNDLEKTAQEIVDEVGILPLIIQLDIGDSGAVKKAIQKISKKFNRIDVLVNNAGVYFEGTTTLSVTDFRVMLETNLTAQFIFLQEVVSIMKQQKSGYIFNVASRAGKIGFAGNGGYNASKFGLVGLSESLYRELIPLGISVTALCPGWVNTKMAFKAGASIEGEQMIQPEDLFKTIQWLLNLSPGACVKEVILETPFSIS